MSNEVMVLESNLSVRFTDTAIKALQEQRQQLVKFVKSQLKKDVDYGIIPGVKSPSLYKPGAEKLANLFQLGSRIIKTDRQIDIKENFAMISHVVEIFHIPTGKVIAQCEGITNSQEKKWRERGVYEWNERERKKVKVRDEPTPIGDVLNTLGKMALKRAYVGAIIMAVGASDFFTQDVEDMPEFQERNPHAAGAVQPNANDGKQFSTPGYVIPAGKWAKRTLEEIAIDEHKNYINWMETNSEKTGKPLAAWQLEYIDFASKYIAAMENQPLDQNEDDIAL